MSNQRNLIFGIDGGGSYSRLMIAEAQSPFAPVFLADGGSSNVNAVGDEGVERNLRDVFAKAEAAGFPAASFKAGCLGAAGAGRDSERFRVEKALRSALGPAIEPPISIVSDHEIALIGGLR